MFTIQALRPEVLIASFSQEDLAKQLIAEREAHGAHRSLADVLSRNKLEYAQAKLLIKAGCFDSIAGELTRTALLWRVFTAQTPKPPSYIPIPQSIRRRSSCITNSPCVAFPYAVIRWSCSRMRSRRPPTFWPRTRAYTWETR